MVSARLPRSLRAAAAAALSLFAIPLGHAATPRIRQAISSQSSVPLRGSTSPVTRAAVDLGPLSAAQTIHGVTLYFQPDAAQQAALRTLIREQQTPGSPSYHRWLTPAQYAESFGLSQPDVAKVTAWLEQQGFAVEGVSNSRTSLRFSGTVAQVQSAFQTTLHSYRIAGETHFANSSDVSIPAALSGVVMAVGNLHDFRPHSMMRRMAPGAQRPGARPAFTSGTSGNNYMQPGDLAVIYDINAAYNAGYTGSGQSIAVVGQSAIVASDIEAFEAAAGLPVKDPVMVLEPGTGASATAAGDESESDIDVEYAGAVARDATIYFVYVGNSSSYSAFDALLYAVDNDIAPIISISYGSCEPDMDASGLNTLEQGLQQAASQGQSVIASAGDTGSTACYADVTSSTQVGAITAQEKALAVDYPASSSYVTAMGGTEFPSADVAAGNTTYWNGTSGTDVVTSAKSYIPEQVWNDDSAAFAQQYGPNYALSAGGGGVSTFSTTNGTTTTPNSRPSWQGGVPGISSAPDYAKNMRMVPDISLDSSPNNAGYLYCTGDTSAWDTTNGQAASCNSGFRDATSGELTVAGGTSFAAPIFAGMLAILNQRENSTGQGVVNPILYTLAANSGTYASAFHDITSGGNQCTAGTDYCSTEGAGEYAATGGYDEASGLGSIDLNNLLAAWPATPASSLAATTVSLAAATSTPAPGAADPITISVVPQSSAITTTPTGTVSLTIDGAPDSTPITLTNGSASYSFTSTTTGNHVILANYSGNSALAPSTGTLVLNVGGTGTAGASFTLAATSITTPQGIAGTSTVTVQSVGGYAGTVNFSLSSSDPNIQNDACYSIDPTAVAANAAASATLTIYTDSADCSAASSARTGKVIRSFRPRTNTARSTPPAPSSAVRYGMAALAGLVLVGSLRRRSLALMGTQCLLLLGIAGLFIGCGGGSSSSSSGSSGSGAASGTAASSTTLSGYPSTAPAAPDAITIKVASGSSTVTATPTGTLSVSVDGGSASSVTLSGGSASYNFSSSTVGSHTVAATYSGDSNYASSTGTLPVAVYAAGNVVPRGNYTIELDGADSSNANLTASTTLTLTLQ